MKQRINESIHFFTTSLLQFFDRHSLRAQLGQCTGGKGGGENESGDGGAGSEGGGTEHTAGHRTPAADLPRAPENTP